MKPGFYPCPACLEQSSTARPYKGFAHYTYVWFMVIYCHVLKQTIWQYLIGTKWSLNPGLPGKKPPLCHLSHRILLKGGFISPKYNLTCFLPYNKSWEMHFWHQYVCHHLHSAFSWKNALGFHAKGSSLRFTILFSNCSFSYNGVY